MQWWLAVLRLTGLFAGIGLATSRIGLVVHELVGHGGAAIAFGGGVSEFRLFWFAGGWIRYDFDEPITRTASLVISLGGIVVEGVIGLALWLALTRKDSLAARLARGVGGALLLHACWYFATGTWHGYGDGLQVHRFAGDWRYPIAIVAGLVTCAIAFATARLVLGALAASMPGGRRTRIAGVVVAGALAGGVQVGLALGELQLRGDRTYSSIQKREGDRVSERELAAWQREQAKRGAVISDAQRELEARRLAARHREPPFLPVLAFLIVVAVAFGASRARAPTDPLTGRLVAITGAVAVGSILVVIVIDTVFR